MHSDVHLMKLFNEDFMVFGPQTHMGQRPLEHRRISIYLYVCPYIHTKIHLNVYPFGPLQGYNSPGPSQIGLRTPVPRPFFGPKAIVPLNC